MEIEKDSCLVFVAEVESYNYVTTSNGNMLPAITFKENETFKKLDIDSFIFDGLYNFNQLKPSTKLCYVEVVKNEDTEKWDLVKFHPIPSSPMIYRDPKKCRACKHDCSLGNDNFYCLNRFCTMNSKAPLRKLIAEANVMTSDSYIDLFLSDFIINGEKVNITNSYEFLQYFFAVKEKNTQSREMNWLLVHGEINGPILWEMEKGVAEVLKQPVIKRERFWDILNLPLNFGDKRYLSRLSPLGGTLDKGAPKTVINVLNQAVESAIPTWIKIFTAYGPKKWN